LCKDLGKNSKKFYLFIFSDCDVFLDSERPIDVECILESMLLNFFILVSNVAAKFSILAQSNICGYGKEQTIRSDAYAIIRNIRQINTHFIVS
jgi:hypothetical protein